MLSKELIDAAAAPQPESVETECIACEGSPKGDNIPCALCGKKPEPVDVEPVGYVDYGDRVEWYTRPPPETDLYTTPQPDRTAELEAALNVARDALKNYGSTE